MEFRAKKQVTGSQTVYLSLGERNPDDILDYQLRPWEGKGMAIRIYSKEKCPACGAAFSSNNGLRCPNHRNVRPVSCFIQVTGVRGYPSNRVRIYSDKEGNPLFVKTVYAVVDRIRLEIQRGVFDPRQYLPQHRNHLLWKNYAKYYLDELQKRRDKPAGSKEWISQSAFDEYEQYQRLYLIPGLGNIALNDLRASDIKRFIRNLKSAKTGKEASDTIKAKALDGVRHILNFAINEEDMPPLAFKIPSVKPNRKRPIQTLTWEEQQIIVNAAPLKHRLILEVLRRTGRRENEARALQVKNVVFSRMEYTVTGAFDEEQYKPFPKVGSTTGAVLPIDEELASLFSQAISNRTCGPDDYLIINPNTGKPYKAVTLNSIFRKARKKAEFPSVTLNEFGRHSWATQRLNEGWSFDQVALFLLNSPDVVRRRYVNVTKATRSAVIEIHKNRLRGQTGGKK